ncbi:hypothetical protein RA086_02555 [Lactiplantibacillus sp. WILCCON 0030]|uniref:YfhO family protein n=1 Tax=Lactiplantibacillus brownii TaxID=3069269 RepID=A0ABU1A6E8_9LACO|nr:hypothetical protein [Lactiplantibacillus brownii]MDQ7936527.1 hypothetical protein [Lactiplantibacillus brownii]
MRKKNIALNLAYSGLFLLIVFIMLYPFWRPHQLVVLSDWSFHASRVEEIFLNLKAGQWLTTIASQTFQGTGSGTFLFYPTPLLYLWAGLRFIAAPLTAFFLWLGLLIWAGLTISFFCCYRLTHRRQQALIFSLVYNLLPYRLMLGLGVFTLAEFVATLFLPLVFLGFYQLLKGKLTDWPLLSLGMTLILYTHLLTAILATEIMTVLLLAVLIYTRHFTKPQWIALLKSIGLTIGLTLPIIIPFFTDFIGQSVATVSQGIAFLLPLNDVVLNSLGNQLTPGIGILLLVPIIFYSKLAGDNHRYQLATMIGGLLLLVSTAIFPWTLLSHTFLAVVQMPYRYLSFAGLFLAVAFAKLAQIGLTKTSLNTKPIIGLGLILIVSGGLYFGEVATTITRNQTGAQLTALPQPKTVGATLPEPFLLRNQNYANQFAYRVKWGETDYFPQKSLAHSESIINNQTYLNHHAIKLRKVSAPNQITYQIKLAKHSVLDFPVVRYHQTTLHVDGQAQPLQTSFRGTVQTELAAGKHTVSIGYQPSKWFFASLFIAFASWLGLAVAVISKWWHSKH